MSIAIPLIGGLIQDVSSTMRTEIGMGEMMFEEDFEDEFEEDGILIWIEEECREGVIGEIRRRIGERWGRVFMLNMMTSQFWRAVGRSICLCCGE